MLRKLFSAVLIITIGLLTLTTAQAADNQIPANPKILIAYFSLTGNTETVANIIKKNTQSKTFKIEPTTPYPKDYSEAIARVRQEINNNIKPELSHDIPEISDYNVIFIGYPIWFSDAPELVKEFLRKHNFKNKVIIPFCTYGSSGSGRSFQSIANLTQGSTNLPGIAIKGSAVINAESSIIEFLKEYNLSSNE